MGIALYPDTQSSTKVKVNVGSTTITVNYGSTTEIISFVGKTIEEVAASINRTSIPLKAVALSSGGYLASSDFVQTGGLLDIPDNFSVYERTTDNGIILRLLRYTVKYNSSAKIQLLPPYKAGYSLPWYPRISVGSFSQLYNNRKFKFGIPEYNEQTWSSLHGMPFKDQKSAPVSIVDVNVLQVARYPIHWTEDNLLFYVDGSPVANMIVEDVDCNNGLIYIKPGAFPNGSIAVDYTYLEKDYLYPYLNINAHFSQNPSLIDKFVIFYLLPLEGTISVRNNRTVFHVVADNITDGIDSIAMDNPDVPIAVIGAYSIQQILSSDRVTILDSRVLGGGLVSKNGLKSPVHFIDDVFTVNPEIEARKDIEEVYEGTESFFDIGHYDGTPYPGAAAIVIGVPESLRTDYTDNFITNKVTKFTAAGVYPIIDFYNDHKAYVSGFSKDISCAANTGLNYSTASNKSGVDWLYNKIEIPNNTVLAPWPTGFDLPTPVVDRLDNSYAVTVGPEASVYQHYLKSNANATIAWEERTVLTSERYTGLNLYTSWEKHQIIDDRDVAEGQLIKGAVQFTNPSTTKQYRNINVYAPYITYSGQLVDKIDGEIRNIIALTTGRVSRGYSYRQVIKNIQYSGLNTSDITGTYLGHHPRLKNIFELVATGFKELTPLAGDMLWLNEILYDPNVIFKEYDPIEDAYSTVGTGVYTYTNNLKLLGDSLYYLGALSGVSGSKYRSYKNILISGWRALALANLAPATETNPYITPDYYSPMDGLFLRRPLNLPPHPGEVNSSYEDHRITELLPALSNFMVAWTGTELYDLPLALKNTFNKAYSYLPAALVGAKTNLGLPCANTWYNTFDRYGEFLGSTLYNASKMLDNYLIVRLRNRSGLSYAGITDNDLIQYGNQFHQALDWAYSGFSEALYMGGGLDTNTPQLLYSYGWAKKMADDVLAISGGFRDPVSDIHATYNHDRVSKFYALFQSGVSIYLKNLVTREGEFQQKNCINQNPGPYSGSPPSKIFEMLGLATYLDSEQFTHLAQAAFCTLTGNYSYSGCYPYDVDLNSPWGGYEAEVLDGLTALRRNLIRSAPVAFTGVIPNPSNLVPDFFEPINTGYTNVRGINFTPVYTELFGYTGVFSGVSNTTAQWRFYQTGSTDRQLGYVRGMGFNSVVVFGGLYDYEHHFATGATGLGNPYIQKYRNLLSLASGHKLYVTPVFFDSTPLTSNPTGDTYNYLYSWVAMPPTGLRTPTWYAATGQYYVRDMIRACSGFTNVLMLNLMNEPNPDTMSGFLRTGIDHIKSLTTGIPLTIGFAASIHRSGTYFTNWSLAYNSGTNSGLDIHSFHPYGIFGDTFSGFLALNRESSPNTPLIVTEFGGPTTAQLHQDLLLYAESGKVGYQFYNNIIAPTGVLQILNNLGGDIFYDGTVPDLYTVSGIQAAARRAYAPTGGFMTFQKPAGYETGFFAPFPIGYSGRNLVEFLQSWQTKQLLQNTPLTGYLRVYQFKMNHLYYPLIDFYYLCDGPFGFTGWYARNFFTTGEQTGILSMITGLTHIDLLGASGIGSPTPGWLYTGTPAFTYIDWSGYDRVFSGYAKNIYGHITGKNMIYI